jgi:hypothetical protein
MIIPIGWEELNCPSAQWPWVKLHEALALSPQGIGSRGEPKDPIPLATLRKRVGIINQSYSVLDWAPDFSKARIECKNKDAHSLDTGEGQCVIFTGADEIGAISYHCSHAHCDCEGGINQEETRWLNRRFTEEEHIVLYNDDLKMEKERSVFFSRALASGNFYRRGDIYPFSTIHWRPGMSSPVPLNVNTFSTAVAREGIGFVQAMKNALKPTRVPEREIKALLEHDEAESFNLAKSYARRPLLIKEDSGGARILSNQYIKSLGIIVLPCGQAEGTELLAHAAMDFGSALSFLNRFLDHWTFREEGDRSRAIAQLLTPALLQGGFIGKPIPPFLCTADLPAAGKTLWHKASGWIYQEKAIPQAYEPGEGIGSLKEIIKYIIVRGDTFLFIDELTGIIKSPLLNAIITGEEEADCRIAFEKTIRASVAHLMVLLAGVKGFVLEETFSTRVMPIRIIKDTYCEEEGNLLESWARMNSVKLLGAIYAIILEWVKKGTPMAERDSRFPGWSMALNAILEEIMGLPKATLGLTNIQADFANERLGWLEQVIDELFEQNLVWNGVGAGTLFKLEQIRAAVNDCGLGFPGAGMAGPGKERLQCGFIGKSISSLQPVNALQGITIFHAGDYFVSRYDCGNNGHGRPFYKYLFSNTKAVPDNIIDYVVPAETFSVEN